MVTSLPRRPPTRTTRTRKKCGFFVFWSPWGEAGVDVISIRAVPRPTFPHGRASGEQVTTEVDLVEFRVSAGCAPIPISGVDCIDLDLVLGLEHVGVADEGADRRCEVAHGRDGFFGRCELGKLVV